MSAWASTSLYLFDVYQDPRTAVRNPLLNLPQKMRFAKMALANTLSGQAAFGKVFGGPQKNATSNTWVT